MSFLESIFNEQFVYALGWTLIHSLWQGALIGLIIAIAMVFMHRYTARLRYFIYSISLLVLAGLAVVTFISAYSNTTPGKIQAEGNTVINNIAYAIPTAPSAVAEIEVSHVQMVLTKTAAYCRTHIPLFVMIWLLGMLAFMLKFLGGYALVRRYRSHQTKAVKGEWEERFSDLARRIKLKKKVRLLESALIKVPMAIGYLKPVVLVPLGALNGVSAEQMEAILAHELAHIHRRDYLINIIQSLMEVAFFYHPVVWWLSKNIRIERENICDDIAITITGNTMEFAKALTNIQEFNLSAPGLAVGLSGRGRNRLVSRIRRITGKPRLQSGYAEGFIAAFILVISLIGLSAAAMITYPVDKELPIDGLDFQEPANLTSFIQKASTLKIVPDSNDQEEETVSTEVSAVEVPDTNDSKHSTSYNEVRQRQYNLFLADSIELPEEVLMEINEMEEELAQIEAQMIALSKEKEYQEALKEYQFYIEQSRSALVRAKEMEAYKEAMKDLQDQWIISRLSSGEIVPCVHALPDGNFFRIDSATWSFRMPEEFIFHTDSLSDFYVDSWRDQFVEMEEFQLQLQEQNLLIAEELSALEELKSLEGLSALEGLEGLKALEGLGGLSQAFGLISQSINIIQEELYADALIDKDRDYIFLINEKQMLINGEKQSRAYFKKYRRLVDSLDDLTAIEDEDGLKIHIEH